MVLKGFCEVQNKEYEIDVTVISANAKEDIVKNNYILGRTTCMYAGFNGCDLKECSILKQHNIKR